MSTVTATKGHRIPRLTPLTNRHTGEQLHLRRVVREPLRFEGVARPVVDLDLYFEAAFDVLNSGRANRPPLFYLAHVVWRHRKTQAVLFASRWLQAVLIPVVVFVGTVLGRYRGTNWPGCPDRYSAAPLVDGPLTEQHALVSLG